MTTYTGSFYFLGQHKPAHFEASSVKALRAQMRAAITAMSGDDWQWYAWRIDEIARDIRKYAAVSREHGAKGLSMAKRPHDPWLDDVTATLPPYPGLNYGAAVNA